MAPEALNLSLCIEFFNAARLGPTRHAAPRRLLAFRSQHRIDFRFLPTRPIASIFAMYANARGTSHAVSPASTVTSPISCAALFACLSSGFT